jgi:hypothetical protein
MNEFEQLKQQMAGLHNLARLQRSLRFGVRAIWLGVGGVILGWGMNAVWGWLPNPLAWYALGIALALFPLAGIVNAFASRKPWVWLLDRRLGLHEQVSTAWEVANSGKSQGIGRLLVQDVLELLPRIRARMLNRGWYLEVDLVSAAIVMLLAGVLLASGLLNPFSDLLGEGPAAFNPPPPPLPPLEQHVPQIPQPGDQPGGDPEGGQQPGAEQPGGQGSGEGQPQEGGEQPGSDPSGSDAELGDILRELGQDLSRQAGTYDLGQALENMDLNGAADALEDLKENLDELSPESRDNLSQAMREAAEALEQAGEQELSQDMSDAADSIPGPSEDAPQNLDEVAGELRELADAMGQSGVAGTGSGEGGSGAGAPEPLDRLGGEGEDMELPLSDPSQSGLLNPSNQGTPGDEVAGGPQDSTYQPGSGVAQNPLYPSSFLWKWRDVVSQYFQR